MPISRPPEKPADNRSRPTFAETSNAYNETPPGPTKHTEPSPFEVRSLKPLVLTPSSIRNAAPGPFSSPLAAQPTEIVREDSGAVVVLFQVGHRVGTHRPALTRALEETAKVLPLYVYDSRELGGPPTTPERIRKKKIQAEIDFASALRKELESLGSAPWIREGSLGESVPDFAKRAGSKKVFMHQDMTVTEIIDADNLYSMYKLSKSLKDLGIELPVLTRAVLLHIRRSSFSVEFRFRRLDTTDFCGRGRGASCFARWCHRE